MESGGTGKKAVFARRVHHVVDVVHARCSQLVEQGSAENFFFFKQCNTSLFLKDRVKIGQFKVVGGGQRAKNATDLGEVVTTKEVSIEVDPASVNGFSIDETDQLRAIEELANTL